jgi:tRNA pseudouridine55 synthase
MLDFRPGAASFRITCSKGTYVRSLVRDVAEGVGTCGTLTRLVRTSAAGIDLSDAHGFDLIESRLNDFPSMVVPMSRVNIGLPRWSSKRVGLTAKLRTGQPVIVELAEYLEGLMDQSDTVPTSWAQSVLLVGEQGGAFGVGSVRRHESGRVAIALKRGL